MSALLLIVASGVLKLFDRVGLFVRQLGRFVVALFHGNAAPVIDLVFILQPRGHLLDQVLGEQVPERGVQLLAGVVGAAPGVDELAVGVGRTLAGLLVTRA